jgi:segregation and condensation protein B
MLPDQNPAPLDIASEQWASMLEAVLLAADAPLPLDALQRLLAEPDAPSKAEVRAALAALDAQLSGRAVELVEVASGWRLQIRAVHNAVVGRLWQEKPTKLSRALLETLAIVCYQQPVTRGDIEEIRGVSLSAGIMRTLLERGWIREVGVKEVPGRPSLFGTTSQLLNDLGLRNLEQLPELPAIKDPEQLEAALLRLNAQGPLLSHSPAADDGDDAFETHDEATRH